MPGVKSISGSIVLMNSASISHPSTTQSSTAVSTAEADYYSRLGSTSRDVAFLRQLLADLNCPPPDPSVIYEDNQACIAISHNVGAQKRTRHIQTKYQCYIRDPISNGTACVKYCPTSKIVADLFTKPFDLPSINHLLMLLLEMFDVHLAKEECWHAANSCNNLILYLHYISYEKQYKHCWACTGIQCHASGYNHIQLGRLDAIIMS
eukprot:scaffold244182_cov49-Prasinocladus_malaysianus.AAC.1